MLQSVLISVQERFSLYLKLNDIAWPAQSTWGYPLLSEHSISLTELIHMISSHGRFTQNHFDGLLQDCSNSKKHNMSYIQHFISSRHMQCPVTTDCAVKRSKYFDVNQVTDVWYIDFLNLILISIRFFIGLGVPMLLDDPMTHCGLVKLYGNMDLAQPWLM